ALDEHVCAGHEKPGGVADDRRVVLSGAGGEKFFDPGEQRQLALARNHPPSIARSLRVACSGSGASPTARMTQARRTPAAINCPKFDSSMPPMAKTGRLTAAAMAATPAGPTTCFSGLTGVLNAGPQPT